MPTAQARETALRDASGRDLVIAKSGVVEAELAKLGRQLRARSRSGGRRVLQDIYEQGHETGLGFGYTPAMDLNQPDTVLEQAPAQEDAMIAELT